MTCCLVLGCKNEATVYKTDLGITAICDEHLAYKKRYEDACERTRDWQKRNTVLDARGRVALEAGEMAAREWMRGCQ